MTILCLDISSTATGWAYFEKDELVKFGLIQPRAKESLDRIRITVSEVVALARETFMSSWEHLTVSEVVALARETVMSSWEHHGFSVYYERSDGKTHGRIARAASLSVLGEAQGSVATALEMKGYTVHAIGTNEWTKSKPKARRTSLVAMMFAEYLTQFGPWINARDGKCGYAKRDPGGDVADAIGLGVYVLGMLKTKQLMEAGR